MSSPGNNQSEKTDVGLSLRWEPVDRAIRGWWDGDVQRAQEAELRDAGKNAIWFVDEEHRRREKSGPAIEEHTLLFLPFPYISAGGSEAAFPEMYCWDIHFINMGLLLHGRLDMVRNHILNHLSLIERFGMVLNGNRTYYLTRSQTPLLAAGIRQYHEQSADNDMLARAYPVLVREYEQYWLAPHHATPTGLATNRDLGDPRLRPALAAEAESLDFTACYDGDVRCCVPLLLNSALVRYEETMAWMAAELRWPDKAEKWKILASQRAATMRELCWDEQQGFFMEYQFMRKVRLQYRSLCAYWALWAGVATTAQAKALVKNLSRFEHAFGLAQTDVAYPSPHPEFTWLQWGYPSGWAPMQMAVVEGLDRYGFHDDAKRIAEKYLTCLLNEYDRTGTFWEKYNVVEGNSVLPRERTPNVPLHGWTTAAAVWLGHRLFRPSALAAESEETL